MKKYWIILPLVLSFLLVIVLAREVSITTVKWHGEGGTIKNLNAVDDKKIVDSQISFRGYIVKKETFGGGTTKFFEKASLTAKGKISPYLEIPFSVHVLVKDFECDSLTQELIHCTGTSELNGYPLDVEFNIEDGTTGSFIARVDKIGRPYAIRVIDIDITKFDSRGLPPGLG